MNLKPIVRAEFWSLYILKTRRRNLSKIATKKLLLKVLAGLSSFLKERDCSSEQDLFLRLKKKKKVRKGESDQS